MGKIMTIEDVVSDVCAPRTDGYVPRDHEEVRALAECMSTMSFSADYEEEGPMTPWSIANAFWDLGLLHKMARMGWIRPDGRVFGCAYGAHERLLRWMGVSAKEAEEGGWVRVGQYKFQCAYRMTREQKERVESFGMLVDDGEERLKPRMPREIGELSINLPDFLRTAYPVAYGESIG
jgi:hypothetical protein